MEHEEAERLRELLSNNKIDLIHFVKRAIDYFEDTEEINSFLDRNEWLGELVHPEYFED